MRSFSSVLSVGYVYIKCEKPFIFIRLYQLYCKIHTVCVRAYDYEIFLFCIRWGGAATRVCVHTTRYSFSTRAHAYQLDHLATKNARDDVHPRYKLFFIYSSMRIRKCWSAIALRECVLIELDTYQICVDYIHMNLNQFESNSYKRKSDVCILCIYLCGVFDDLFKIS